MQTRRARAGPRRLAGLLAAVGCLAGCSSAVIDATPPTVQPARAALSPPALTTPAGAVIAPGAPGGALDARYDRASRSLLVLTPGPQATLTVLGGAGPPRTVALPAAATALATDGDGTAYASTRGGVIVVDLAAGTATRTGIPGESETDFTAVACRADGRLLLGSADGAAFVLGPDMSVSHRTGGFARVDAIVTVGDTAVVLDRGQTSVTALDARGDRRQALRAGLGATSIAADPAGRVLVTDTRGGQLLVYSVDPLIQRQAYPVADSPFGLAGSDRLAWVSQTATNTVIGYDLATGIPVEKVRYPTVQQPNSLAFDDSSSTLYVVSGSGGGVQVIRDAGGPR